MAFKKLSLGIFKIMTAKKAFKLLLKIFPHGLVFWAMNIAARIKYHITIGKKSRVYLDCFFEGHNAVFNDSQVQGCYVGVGTYIANHSEISSAKIGRFCSIGSNVKIKVGQHPSSQ